MNILRDGKSTKKNMAVAKLFTAWDDGILKPNRIPSGSRIQLMICAPIASVAQGRGRSINSLTNTLVIVFATPTIIATANTIRTPRHLYFQTKKIEASE
jgi:hypothetical protein